MKLRLLVLASAFALAFLAPSASATAWWVNACDNYTPVMGVLGGSTAQTGPNQWTGCIKAPQLETGPANSSWDGFKLAWNIAVNPNAPTVNYNYRIFGIERGGVSNFILGLSDNCLTNLTNVPRRKRSCIWDLETTGDIDFDTEYRFGNKSFGPGPGTPGFPAGGSIRGIKFDDLSDDPINFGFSFTSSRLPVWQNFYAKGEDDYGDNGYGDDDYGDNGYGNGYGFSSNGKGKGGNGNGNGGNGSSVNFLHAYNSGLAGGQFFVLAPNGVVPEPGFYGLLSVGVAGLFLAVRRRRKNG